MMKLITTLLFTIFATITASSQVVFHNKTTDDLRAMAVSSNKLVFIDLFASWCPPCRQMERVFDQREVGDFFDAHFVAAKYDVDKPLGAALLSDYTTNGSIPTYLIFNTEGDLVGRIQGASRADVLIRDLQTIIQRSKVTSKTSNK